MEIYSGQTGYHGCFSEGVCLRRVHYEQFRPEVPHDAKGWGANGVLDLDRIRAAGDG
jgi:hypothetical protein